MKSIDKRKDLRKQENRNMKVKNNEVQIRKLELRLREQKQIEQNLRSSKNQAENAK